MLELVRQQGGWPRHPGTAAGGVMQPTYNSGIAGKGSEQ